MFPGVFDLNFRVPPTLNTIVDFAASLSRGARIYKSIQPILLLYKPWGEAAQLNDTVALIGIYAFSLDHFSKSRNEKIYYAFIIAGSITSLALSIILPKAPAIGANSIYLWDSLKNIPHTLKERKFSQAGKELLSATHQAIYVAAIAFGKGEILAISLIAQASLELYSSYSSLTKEHGHKWDYFNGFVNLTLAGLRIKAAMPLMK